MTRKYLTRAEAADYLSNLGIPCKRATLAKYACQGGGPRYVKFGFRTLYRPADLDAWIEQSCVSRLNTSDPGTSVALFEREALRPDFEADDTMGPQGTVEGER